jgi:hypothetical protein
MSCRASLTVIRVNVGSEGRLCSGPWLGSWKVRLVRPAFSVKSLAMLRGGYEANRGRREVGG